MIRFTPPGISMSLPIEREDVTDAISEVLTLAAGHPLRRQRCILCGSLIGGRQCRLVTVTDWRHRGCTCGEIPSVAYLMCAEHPADDDGAVCSAVMDRWTAHHGQVLL